MDAVDGSIEDEFHEYVKPTEIPILSDYCQRETGVSQDMVDRAQTLSKVMDNYKSWLDDQHVEKHLRWTDKVDERSNVTYCACTHVELERYLRWECNRKDIKVPSPMTENWINIQILYYGTDELFMGDLTTCLDEMDIYCRRTIGIEFSRCLSKVAGDLVQRRGQLAIYPNNACP